MTATLAPDTEVDGVAAQATESDLDAQGPAADLVRVYLNGIGKTALLTAADEVELAKRIEAGVYAQHLTGDRPPHGGP
jgi:RNA polymerase nonessential primary-like sigma factor